MAQRLLLASENFSDRTLHTLGCREAPGWKSGAFISSAALALPWRQKLQEWTRWTAPISKNPKTDLPVDGQTAIDDSDVPSDVSRAVGTENGTVNDPFTTSQPSDETRNKVKKDDIWQTTELQSSSALFGTILHNHPGASTKDLPTSPWGSVRTLRAFSTALPNLTNVLRHAALYRETNVESLTVRLLPNPFAIDPATKRPVGAGVLSAFPAVEMQFDIHQDQPFKLRYVEAIVRENKADFMLPDQPVDIRFLHRVTRRLKREKLGMSELIKFMENSYVTKTARRLDVPPAIALPISSSLCRSDMLKKVGRDPAAPLHNVEYLFAERELRSTMSMTWNDWRLDLTYINGGKSSGKRSELVLKPLKPTSDSTSQDFMQAAFGVADSFGSPPFAPIRKPIIKNDLTRVLFISAEKQGPQPRIMKMRARRFGEFNTGKEGAMKRMRDALSGKEKARKDKERLGIDDGTKSK